MATMQGVHYVTLAIHFTYNDKITSLEDAVYFSKDLDDAGEDSEWDIIEFEHELREDW